MSPSVFLSSALFLQCLALTRKYLTKPSSLLPSRDSSFTALLFVFSNLFPFCLQPTLKQNPQLLRTFFRNFRIFFRVLFRVLFRTISRAIFRAIFRASLRTFFRTFFPVFTSPVVVSFFSPQTYKHFRHWQQQNKLDVQPEPEAITLIGSFLVGCATPHSQGCFPHGVHLVHGHFC